MKGAEVIFLIGSVAAFVFFAATLIWADAYSRDVREGPKK